MLFVNAAKVKSLEDTIYATFELIFVRAVQIENPADLLFLTFTILRLLSTSPVLITILINLLLKLVHFLFDLFDLIFEFFNKRSYRTHSQTLLWYLKLKELIFYQFSTLKTWLLLVFITVIELIKDILNESWRFLLNSPFSIFNIGYILINLIKMLWNIRSYPHFRIHLLFVCILLLTVIQLLLHVQFTLNFTPPLSIPYIPFLLNKLSLILFVVILYVYFILLGDFNNMTNSPKELKKYVETYLYVYLAFIFYCIMILMYLVPYIPWLPWYLTGLFFILIGVIII